MTKLYHVESEEVVGPGPFDIHWGTRYDIVDATGTHIEGFLNEDEAIEECDRMNSEAGRQSEKA